MHKNVTLSISVDRQFADRVEALTRTVRDPYGKPNRAHVLRLLVEAGLERYERQQQPDVLDDA